MIPFASNDEFERIVVRRLERNRLRRIALRRSRLGHYCAILVSVTPASA